MITKLYEVTCDFCGTCMNHYIGKKPNNDELIKDGFAVAKTKQFCSEKCHSDWMHNLQEKKYLNLRQKGRIYHDN